VIGHAALYVATLVASRRNPVIQAFCQRALATHKSKNWRSHAQDADHPQSQCAASGPVVRGCAGELMISKCQRESLDKLDSCYSLVSLEYFGRSASR
jgi:hypothetical protein